MSSPRPRRTLPGMESLEARQVLSTTDFVTGLYTEVLHQTATTSQVGFWLNYMNQGHSRSEVANLFWTSTPHLQFEAEREYQTIVHRDADAQGLAAATTLLARGITPSDLDRILIDSPAYQATHASTTSFIQGLYLDLFHRSADAPGLNAWVSMIDHGGVSRDAATQIFLNSPFHVGPEANELYEDTFHRDADAPGAAVLEDNPARFNDIAVDLLTSSAFEIEHEHGSGHG